MVMIIIIMVMITLFLLHDEGRKGGVKFSEILYFTALTPWQKLTMIMVSF